jgi:hypothetical protein
MQTVKDFLWDLEYATWMTVKDFLWDLKNPTRLATYCLLALTLLGATLAVWRYCFREKD